MHALKFLSTSVRHLPEDPNSRSKVPYVDPPATAYSFVKKIDAHQKMEKKFPSILIVVRCCIPLKFLQGCC